MAKKCNQKEQKNSILTIAYSRQIQTRNPRTRSALKPSISSHSKAEILKPCPSSLTNGLRLHQFLVTKSAEANKPVKTDANGAH